MIDLTTAVALAYLVDRFWSKVNKRGDDECWEWTGSLEHGHAGRYGYMRDGRDRIRVTRFSWVLHNGPIPDGMMVCHHCDNPPCVNPRHLFLGTQHDNMVDMHAKHRHPRRVPRKLNDIAAARIRELYAHGMRNKELAEMFGVQPSTITYVVQGRTWGPEARKER